jgi:hypothetical protein
VKSLIGLGLAAGLLSFAPAPGLRAETRGKPYTEGQLLARCATAFVGEVLETRTFAAHERTVPTRARVLLSIKGEVRRGERVLAPKDPGAHVYFEEEFSRPGKGRLGVFYVGVEGRPDLLLGYRQLPDQD